MLASKKSNDTIKIDPCKHLMNQSCILDFTKQTRTNPGSKQQQLPIDNMETIRDILDYVVSKYTKKPCFGIRPNFDTDETWKTYEQVDGQIRAIGSALRQLNKSSQAESNCIGICGRNCPEWVCTQYACGSYGLIAVPLYDTLGQEALEHIFKQTGMRIVFCDTLKRAEQFLTWASDQLDYIVVMRYTDEEMVNFKSESSNDVTVVGYRKLVEMGIHDPIQPTPSKPDDLCLLCYTSGSTGMPKGVMYTHRIFLGCLANVMDSFNAIGIPYDNELHVSFLPLSHIMEQLVIADILIRGNQAAFLTTNLLDLRKDFIHYRPTIFAAVPRLLTRIYTETMRDFGGSPVKNWLLQRVIRSKLFEQKNGIYSKSGILDRLFFRNIREMFGGRVRFVICGSAPLSAAVRDFTRAAFSSVLVEGYGSTESGGLATCTFPGDFNAQHAGSPAIGVTVKLIDVPSMGIEVKRDGMGEVCVKSKSCTTGYFKDEEKTRELFDEDGFVRMGDIGIWTEFGALKIVDRCKNIFKLAQGEYVAPEKVEQAYASSTLVHNVYVDGRSDQSFAVAIVVPDCKSVLQEWPQELAELQNSSNQAGSETEPKSSEPSDQMVCSSKLVNKLMLAHLNELGQKNGLKGFEQVKRIQLHPEPFSIQNGLLTPTMKAARPNLRRRFDPVVEELYAKTDA